jgi:hypothetical protein
LPATPKIKSKDCKYLPISCEWRFRVLFANEEKLAVVATEWIKYSMPSYFSEYIMGEFVCLANKRMDFKEAVAQLFNEIYF